MTLIYTVLKLILLEVQLKHYLLKRIRERSITRGIQVDLGPEKNVISQWILAYSIHFDIMKMDQKYNFSIDCIFLLPQLFILIMCKLMVLADNYGQ